MSRSIIIVLAFIGLMFFLYVESREFRVTKDGKYITIWKPLNNKFYIVTGRYYGLFRPIDENYVQTTNDATSANILWQLSSDSLIVEVGGDYKIFNNGKKNESIFIDYNLNKKRNDSLYTEIDTATNLNRYKKGINRIYVMIDKKGAL